MPRVSYSSSIRGLTKRQPKVVSSGRDDVAVLQRGTTLTVANLGEFPFAINLGEGQWRVVFASQGGDGDVASGMVNISGETTVVLVPA